MACSNLCLFFANDIGGHPYFSSSFTFYLLLRLLSGLPFARFLSVCFSPFSVRCSFFQVISKCVLVPAEIWQSLSDRSNLRRCPLSVHLLLFRYSRSVPESFTFIPVSSELLSAFFSHPFHSVYHSISRSSSLSNDLNLSLFVPSSPLSTQL